MIWRQHRDRVEHVIVIVGMTCDRCGEDMRRVIGAPSVSHDFDFRGCEVNGGVYPTMDIADARRLSAQLCEPCTEWLIGAIKDYRQLGPRLQTLSEWAKEFVEARPREEAS